MHMYVLVAKSTIGTQPPSVTHLHACKPERGLDVLCHPERNPLGDAQTLALLKADVVVHVDDLPRSKLHQQVVKVTVAEADDVTNHAHDGGGAVVGLRDGPPLGGTGGGAPQLPGRGYT